MDATSLQSDAPSGGEVSKAAASMDRLASIMDACCTPACVGIDPDWDRLPESLRATCGEDHARAIEAFSLDVVAAVAGTVPAVKLQSACFERYASRGWAAMERVVEAARAAGLWVLLDAKRGDISTSARHYAASAVDLGADGITVNPYLGPSAIEPFLEAGLAVFALCRTSNPDSDELQATRLDEGMSVAERVAEMLAAIGQRWMGFSGLSALGAVVGATKMADALTLRGRMPCQMLLTPGIGAQGASTADIARLARPGARSLGSLGVMPTASRSVIYASAEDGQSWQEAVAIAARALATEAAGVAGSP